MAKLHFPTLLCLFIFLFLLVSTEMQVTQAKVCQRRSKTWSGFCGSTKNCDRQCKNWEGALHGACHAQFPGVACFCYFKC
ncbi:defensin-like protein 19 [Ricinus communis]|uniref:Low-molecular-weight cysteine-rich protein LCR78, putative n=1 Tax=Ricinus communis TaxID=3988 RepID=B9R7X8_RICCO|nr:defensin-like protein 19 [Ricinus communis]EEF52608.1 Low-molecular-weight cysteine-rich protein LCR78 precursor, putative [Ricinus communis]|eukprot:XP_002510421.1 defensin-like protein 19 [Ricinus communis]